MKSIELSESVLKTLNVFEFVQFVDELYQRGDESSATLLDAFFIGRYGVRPEMMEGMLPIMQLKTALALNFITFCYGSRITDDEWREVGFTIHYEYGIDFSSLSGGDAGPAEVARVIWAACSHIADAEHDLGFHPAVAFDAGVVMFTTVDAQVKFTTEKGFVQFLSGYLRAVRAIVRSRMSGD